MSNEIAQMCEADGGSWDWNGTINAWCCNNTPSDEYLENILKATATPEALSMNENNISLLRNAGNLHYFGIHVEKNIYRAFELYLKAANKDDLESLDKIGKMYIIGEGTNVNFFKANDAYTKACNLGYQQSCKSSEELSLTLKSKKPLNQRYDLSNLELSSVKKISKQHVDSKLTNENLEIIKTHVLSEILLIDKNVASNNTKNNNGYYGLGLDNLKKNSDGVYVPKNNASYGLSAFSLILDSTVQWSDQKKAEDSKIQKLKNRISHIMANEQLMKCSVDKIYGEPSISYDEMLVLTFNKIAIILNATDVNDFHILHKPSFELEYNSSTQSTLLLHETKLLGTLDKAKSFYYCEEVPNTVFKID
jgi:hypothetical protein